MSAVPADRNVSSAVNTGQTNQRVALLAGRISQHRVHEGKHYTLVILPSEDEFSAPAVVEIQSSGQLGAAGDDWRGRVRLGGYRRRITDRQTGEVYYRADVTLAHVAASGA